MDTAVIGFLVVFVPIHVLLVVVPITNTIRSSISSNSKWFWCAFLVFLPVIGVVVFHFLFRSSLFQGKSYEISAAEERARSGTLSPEDD